MDSNTFGKSDAASTLARLLETDDFVRKGVTRKLNKYQKGIRNISEIRDVLIRNRVLHLWRETHVISVDGWLVSDMIKSYVKNVMTVCYRKAIRL